MTDIPFIPARLELDQVSVSYDHQPALTGLTFSVPHGAQVAVVGPNGAGKSTLFKALVGLLPLQSGQILIHGQPLRAHTDCVAYVPQREEVDWRFPVTVSDVVMMGCFGRQGWLKGASRRDRQVVHTCLVQMGIESLADKPINDLSGGQQQRVFLARALAQEPHILLMDEPFTGVDLTTQQATLDLLGHLKEQGVTVLVSTHDLNMAAERFEYTLLLKHRLIAFGKAVEVFTPGNIRETFGSQVLRLGDSLVIDECCSGTEEDHLHA
jgi:manganese/iron transport system ATP-binding protein